ncbi:MAG: two-component system response regulator [Nitrospirales bacterium]|nr:MAG: two-component system response regulator [Nitrospirales bacterium]
MVSTPQQPILLVEDSPEDYEITVRSLLAAGLSNPIKQCTNGDEALEYLHQRRKNANDSISPLPGMIFLDLNLPGTDGREVLAEIKQDVYLKVIPVIILTTSTDDRDIQACYALGANSYIPKPLDFEGFMKAMSRLKDYWFEVVVMPNVGAPI